MPDITHQDAGNRALAEDTQRLLKAEEDDRIALEQLRKRLRPFRGITLWDLIVDLMLLDTEKHIHILQAIAKNTKSR